MITIYLYDAMGVFTSTQEVDPMGALPPNCATTAPPETSGNEVAVWSGASWVVLDERPVAPTIEAPRQNRHITVLAFRNRFTTAEKTKIELAACDNPFAPIEDRAKSATLRAILADQAAATFVDLDREDVKDPVNQLEAMGLLDSEGRAKVILDTPVQDIERVKA